MDVAVPLALFGAVRAALKHLHDPIALRSSLLVSLLHLADRRDPCARLRTILRETIEALEPEDQVPSHSHAWRIYEVLLYRYLEESTQQQVANQLGIGVRHLRREERDAIGVLTAKLATRFPAELAAYLNSAEEDEAGEEQAVAAAPNNEEWLPDAAAHAPVALDHLLPALLTLLTPLAQQYQARLTSEETIPAQTLDGDEILIRQILLNLLTVAIRAAPGGEVRVSCLPHSCETEILVRGLGSPTGKPLSAEDLKLLDLTRNMAAAAQAKLQGPSLDQEFSVSVTLPLQAGVPILVIEDNQDTLLLLQRQVLGTPYRIIPANIANQALSLVQSCAPQAILLDVMMPHTDGWDVLRTLKRDAAACSIPVVVCTVLPQKELALSLGANGFLQKPFTRQTLLSALEAVVAVN